MSTRNMRRRSRTWSFCKLGLWIRECKWYMHPMMDGLLESSWFSAVSLWARKACWEPTGMQQNQLDPDHPSSCCLCKVCVACNFYFILLILKIITEVFFFFQNPQRSACSSLPRRGKEKEPKNVLYLLGGWVGSTPYTSYLEHDSNPNKTPPYYYSHTCSSNPTAGVKIFVFFNTKNSVFFFFFWGVGEFWNPFNLGIYGIHNFEVSNSLTLCIVWIIVMSRWKQMWAVISFAANYHNYDEKNLRNFLFFIFCSL